MLGSFVSKLISVSNLVYKFYKREVIERTEHFFRNLIKNFCWFDF